MFDGQLKQRPIRIVVTSVALGFMVVAALPAVGSMFVLNEPWEESDTGSFDDCGPVIDYQWTDSGLTSIRRGTGRQATAFFLNDRVQSEETWTNLDGKFVSVSRNFQVHDVQAKPLGGSIFEFTTDVVGTTIIRDMNGRKLIQDNGRESFTYIFDTEGDAVPGGHWLGEVSYRQSGRNPWNQADQCALVETWLG